MLSNQSKQLRLLCDGFYIDSEKSTKYTNGSGAISMIEKLYRDTYFYWSSRSYSNHQNDEELEKIFYYHPYEKQLIIENNFGSEIKNIEDYIRIKYKTSRLIYRIPQLYCINFPIPDLSENYSDQQFFEIKDTLEDYFYGRRKKISVQSRKKFFADNFDRFLILYNLFRDFFQQHLFTRHYAGTEYHKMIIPYFEVTSEEIENIDSYEQMREVIGDSFDNL